MSRSLPASSVARRLVARLGHQHVARARRRGSRGRRSRGLRRSIDGMPWSSRIPWIISPSARLRAPVDPDQLAAGVLRPDLARPLVRVGDRLLLAVPGVDERHPAVAAEALAERMGERAARAGERLSPRARSLASLDGELDLADLAVLDAEAAQRLLALRERDDQVERVGVGGEVDVGLRGIGRARGVGVVDRRQLLARSPPSRVMIRNWSWGSRL